MNKFKVGDKVISKTKDYDEGSFPEKKWGNGFRYLEKFIIEGFDGAHYFTTTSKGKRVYFDEKNLEFCGKDEPKKYDSDKPRMDLIRPEFSLALGDVLGYGTSKYEEVRGDTPNYLKGGGFQYSKILASLERHIAAFKMGINIDEESSRHHLAHAAANIMFLLTYELTEKGIDDRVVLGGSNESKDKEIT